MRKIPIAGCSGMLGEAFQKRFSLTHELKCTDNNANKDWPSVLDFRGLDAYCSDVTAFRPDVLFYLGAHTDLEYCEGNIEEGSLTEQDTAVLRSDLPGVTQVRKTDADERANEALRERPNYYGYHFAEIISRLDTYPFNNAMNQSVAARFDGNRRFFVNIPCVAPDLSA